MLHRDGTFDEWQLAEAARKYIPIYVKDHDTTCLVPYKDLPTGEIKFVQFEYLNQQWVYVDNDQE